MKNNKNINFLSRRTHRTWSQCNQSNGMNRVCLHWNRSATFSTQCCISPIWNWTLTSLLTAPKSWSNHATVWMSTTTSCRTKLITTSQRYKSVSLTTLKNATSQRTTSKSTTTTTEFALSSKVRHLLLSRHHLTTQTESCLRPRIRCMWAWRSKTVWLQIWLARMYISGSKRSRI